MRLMKQLRDTFGTSILMITHNLGVVAKVCDTVNVMYMGQIVESCDVFSLFERPLHPYTLGLLGSVPRVETGRERLKNIPGTVPTLYDVPKGCRFAERLQPGDSPLQGVHAPACRCGRRPSCALLPL